MPGFEGSLSKTEIDGLTTYISMMTNSKPATTIDTASANVNYVFQGYTKFLDPDGYPAVSAPWGTLDALNLNTGRYVWKIPVR